MNDEQLQVALRRLNGLLEEGTNRGLQEVNAAGLATADKSGRPSLRTVNILAIETEGLVFFAHRNSGKGKQLMENPLACLCFFWPELSEQVILEGPVAAEPEEAADRYWQNMPRERQLFTWLAADTAPSQRRGALRNSVNEHWRDAGYKPISRHQDWVAFRLRPVRIEFWPVGWRRAQERIRYTATDDDGWTSTLVIP